MDRNKMTIEQLKRVDDLERASYCDIIKISDLESLIDENILSSTYDRHEIKEDAKKF